MALFGKESPFPFYEASTLGISSPAGTLCSIAEERIPSFGEELIAFGLDVFWEMTLACSSTTPPRLGSVPSCHHSNIKGLCLRQPNFMQEGDSG